MSEASPKDEKWMAWLRHGATLFSTCGKAQYMALLIDSSGHVVGHGYNGAPSGMEHCVDGGCPRFQNGTPSGSPYDDCIAIHAETNAILHSNYAQRREGVTLYVNGVPCFDCAKNIANADVARVVFDDTAAQPRADRGKALAFLRAVGIDLCPLD